MTLEAEYIQKYCEFFDELQEGFRYELQSANTEVKEMARHNKTRGGLEIMSGHWVLLLR